MKIFDLAKNKIRNFINKILGKQAPQIAQKNRIKEDNEIYRQLVESIDDLELGRIFLENVPQDTKSTFEYYQKRGKKEDVYCHPLRSKMSIVTAIDLAGTFFESIDVEYGYRISRIIDKLDPDCRIIYEDDENAKASTTSPDKKPIEVHIPNRDDIRVLYELVHELTHVLDTKNGDTVTRRIKGEIAPQCMERLLDVFLLGLSEDELENSYFISKDFLEQDIRDRIHSTFLSRYNNAYTLIHDRRTNRELDSRYMLAQIYSTHFMNIEESFEAKKERIKRFITCVEEDKFDEADDAFGMKLDKKFGLHRQEYASQAARPKSAIEGLERVIAIEEQELDWPKREIGKEQEDVKENPDER